MPLTEAAVREALGTVNDPDLGRDLVTLGMVGEIGIDGANVRTTIELTTPACPMKDRIEADIKQAISEAASRAGAAVKNIDVTFTANTKGAAARLGQPQQSPLPDVAHIIAVGAGKGGVGKSTVSVNMAVGLARRGARVGLLDGDIYGPSLPTMLGLQGMAPTGRGRTLMPFEKAGLKIMTMGQLVDRDRALIWRGPKAHGAFTQLATQTDWGALDYLIIDLPPGTGDIILSVSQLLPLRGAVVVCTPQQVAQDDARRAVRMFQQLDVPLLGIVENMSYFIGDDGKEYDIFGRGGAEMLAQEMNLPFLGSVPIHMELRANSDAGDPERNFSGNEQLTSQLETLTNSLVSQVSIAAMSGQYMQPTLSVR